eukprot:11039140-Karenia_brevis.AAC.1
MKSSCIAFGSEASGIAGKSALKSYSCKTFKPNLRSWSSAIKSSFETSPMLKSPSSISTSSVAGATGAA